MAARGRMKTMVPRARSTLDGQSEVKQRKATQVFLLLQVTILILCGLRPEN